MEQHPTVQDHPPIPSRDEVEKEEKEQDVDEEKDEMEGEGKPSHHHKNKKTISVSQQQPFVPKIGRKRSSRERTNSNKDDNNDNDDFTAEEEPPRKYPNRSRAQNFPKIIHVSPMDPQKRSFPFLEEQDPRDYEIFRFIRDMDRPPWLVPGGIIMTWERIATTLSSDTMKHPRTGQRLFPYGISNKVLKERFDRVACCTMESRQVRSR